MLENITTLADLQQNGDIFLKVQSQGDQNYKEILDRNLKIKQSDPELRFVYTMRKDQGGIFRVHQFDKIEQFCITEPEKSWEMMDSMMKVSEEFYQSLKIPYKIISFIT